ncbi:MULTISPECIES: bifunctional phosphopantothenoylcysteine decarboxylase/phosphopantothenate--cysteine ligase CoaBC [Campylobacter]|uniref:bifunctional phosphopantothenoylcysteine decarboxylase/phosphopantothenate--cysteine ligase CoaBC n=1 Tax=Campylobacter TaxID=194 RepID=UPI000A33A946|nr:MULTISPECIES: bifunctional phosphopantothenoylcysteine decarboxylase/phosphopantothenate--cysteine ligase CoaBC [unclassified Campylobacter]MCR8695675.1 bifunctional phosphopantothenoylcysteine decarboxylase/phosphopantothenate--cysteine ligase CoaBC [Campylobacter sp. RM19073]
MKNRDILLAVCGSISFYKAYEILSLLKNNGANVRVLLSDGALKFTTPIGFEALSNGVLSSLNESWVGGLDHISFSKNDLIIIAPATANSINKIALGIADNIFLQTILAASCPKIIAPAANHNMLQNPATTRNLELLKDDGFIIIEPIAKTLACLDYGKGGLNEPWIIVETAKRVLNQDKFYQGKKVIITGGPTIEKIDDARAITNHSSGKMAKALADSFYYAGADVVFISSVDFDTPYETIKFKSSNELLNALNSQKVTQNDILVMCAAVSDFICLNPKDGKIKKDQMGDKIELKLNIDILKNLNLKCKKIGFKMEMDAQNALNNAKNMLIDKNLDAVCLNILNDEIKFGSIKTQISFITKDSITQTDLAPKELIASQITKLVKNL